MAAGMVDRDLQRDSGLALRAATGGGAVRDRSRIPRKPGDEKALGKAWRLTAGGAVCLHPGPHRGRGSGPVLPSPARR